MAKQVNYRPYGLTDSKWRRIENPVVRDHVVFKKYGWETGGSYTEIEVVVRPGGGVPVHLHETYTERMSPVEGRLGLQSGIDGGHGGGGKKKKEMLLGPGEHYTVARNEWHRFFNPSATDPCTFRVRCEPAVQGFEIMLAIAYGVASDGGANPHTGAPANFFDALWIMAISDMTMPGLSYKLLMMLSWALMMIAEWSGRKDRMIRKYYGEPVENAKTK